MPRGALGPRTTRPTVGHSRKVRKHKMPRGALGPKYPVLDRLGQFGMPHDSCHAIRKWSERNEWNPRCRPQATSGHKMPRGAPASSSGCCVASKNGVNAVNEIQDVSRRPHLDMKCPEGHWPHHSQVMRHLKVAANINILDHLSRQRFDELTEAYQKNQRYLCCAPSGVASILYVERDASQFRDGSWTLAAHSGWVV